MSQPSILSLERFATVMAQVAHFGRSDEPELLARSGIGTGLWRESRHHWLGRLALPDEAAARDFGRVFAQTAQALDRVMPALSDLGPRLQDIALNPDEPETLMADSVDPATVMRPGTAGPPSDVLATAQLAQLSASDALASLPSSKPIRQRLEPLTDLHSTLPSSVPPRREAPSVPDAAPLEAEDHLASTVFGTPPNVQPPPTSVPTSSHALSPEQYARLAHATHLAPSVMRERVHHELGIKDEEQRRIVDRQMTDRFSADPASYQLYMRWVQYLRQGGA